MDQKFPPFFPKKGGKFIFRLGGGRRAVFTRGPFVDLIHSSLGRTNCPFNAVLICFQGLQRCWWWWFKQQFIAARELQRLRLVNTLTSLPSCQCAKKYLFIQQNPSDWKSTWRSKDVDCEMIQALDRTIPTFGKPSNFESHAWTTWKNSLAEQKENHFFSMLDLCFTFSVESKLKRETIV